MKTTSYIVRITTPDSEEFDSDLLQQIFFDCPELEDCLITVKKEPMRLIDICLIDESELSEDKKIEHCELTLICEDCKYCDKQAYERAYNHLKSKEKGD